MINFGMLNCLTFDKDMELVRLVANGGFVESLDLVCTGLYFNV